MSYLFQDLILILIRNSNTWSRVFVEWLSFGIDEHFLNVQEGRAVTGGQIIGLEVEEVIDEQRLMEELRLLFAVREVLERRLLVDLVDLDARRFRHLILFGHLAPRLWLS